MHSVHDNKKQWTKKFTKRKKGVLIVIDGNDGSGKATQAALLVGKLQKEGFLVKKIDFPRYEENFFGKFIGECVRGERGDFSVIDPKIASVLYAADRFETRELITSWLKKGYVVVADRYVSANQIHQGGKIIDKKERISFLEWLHHMEHAVFKIPKPDLVVYLSVPVSVSLERLKKSELINKKKYLKGGKDILEQNIQYLKNSKSGAEWISKVDASWRRVDCCPKGKNLFPEEVHLKVYKIVGEFLAKGSRD